MTALPEIAMYWEDISYFQRILKYYNVALCTLILLLIMASCKYVLRERLHSCGFYQALTIADYLEEPRPTSSCTSLVIPDGQDLSEGVYAVERLVHCRRRKV